MDVLVEGMVEWCEVARTQGRYLLVVAEGEEVGAQVVGQVLGMNLLVVVEDRGQWVVCLEAEDGMFLQVEEEEDMV